MSGLLGDEERPDRSWTVGDDGRHSRTEAVTVQALAPPGWLRRSSPARLCSSTGAIRPPGSALRPWFDDAGLASRARLASGG